MRTRRFTQVDVFASAPFTGNPLAVVHDADDLSDDAMQAIARWTNLSETTFLLQPTDPAADYRVRIFTGGGELPFAGHPTLGSAHAWLVAGGVPASAEAIVQQCGVGLVTIRPDADRLAFAAPPLLRSGDVEASDLRDIALGIGVEPAEVIGMNWIDNGPGWVGVELRSADAVLAVQPDPARLSGRKIALVGVADDPGVDVEVRAFFSSAPGAPVVEDPVTGSANAGLALWLIDSGRLPARYVARQGTAVGADGRVLVELDADGRTWIGGTVRTVVDGTITC